MLFKINQVDTNMVYLNEVLKHFIENSVSLSKYQKTALFPVEFIPVHDNEKNALDKKFKAVFEQVKKLDQTQKKQLKRMYVNQQRTKRLCQDNTPIVDFSAYPESLKEKLKSLGEYLYTSGLKNAEIKQLAIDKYGDNNSTLYEHWLEFKKINGVVCCFCGIEDYEEQLPNTSKTKWRPAYDHYLPKEKYPLAAVNFNNLIPCCYQCNSKAKGAFDPCYCEKSGRKKAKYPFDNSTLLGLKFKFAKEKITGDGPWVVSLKDETDESHQSWDRVYKIKERVASRLNSNYISWLRRHRSDVDKAPDIAGKKAALRNKAAELITEVRQQREYIHQANLLVTLSNESDGIVESILQTIQPEPDPLTKQDGHRLLKEHGFSFT
ncbi:hypothetical protein [Undibacterium curvum]|jgi:hypothetical protein|uniref:hypothetical protein n=1 Tax=Undibacterium curvum TaxID=2762294 RepID=UPI003D1175B5